MLYILRLRKGDCILAVARNEEGARHLASALGTPPAEVVSVRQLSRFAVRLSPTVAGALETHSWDDVTLDDILVHEYPVLNEAFHAANKARFMPPTDFNKPLLTQLRDAYESNTEIIRKGLRLERQRFSSEPDLKARKAAR